ncbi:Kiwa anti-phage protein KwaB-like domain-containing protein [Oenococcus sp.]|uniref:Kiwa anti-phage protein KwaB-like domain-containing protein n=1 Tax=Oenococcus sp. TaxID=1979414 RepID=UPI0039EB4A1F
MNLVRIGEESEYRKLSIELKDISTPDMIDTIPFDAEKTREEDEWFYIQIDEPHKQMINDYADCFSNSASLNEISDKDFSKIDVIAKQETNGIIFQKITPSKRMVKASILRKPLDKKAEINTIDNGIELTSKVDAYYSEGKLYFKYFSTIRSMFKDIEEFYRVATSDEVHQFKEMSLVSVGKNFNDLGTRNLKMLAAIKDDSEINFSDVEFRNRMFEEYLNYPDLDFQVDNGQFVINTKKQLNLFLKLALGRLYENPMTRQKMEASSAKAISKTNGETKNGRQ